MMVVTSAERLGEDEALAEQVQRGARSSFVLLVARYRDRIYRLALRMSHNPSDAEEITQETFLRAYRGIGTFQGEAKFGTWLYRIAMNEALMRRRSARRRPVESLDALGPRLGEVAPLGAAPFEAVAALVDGKALAGRVREALEQLDTEQRAALVLRDLEGLSAEEAADVLGVSPVAVRQRAHRARLKLRDLLADLLPAEA